MDLVFHDAANPGQKLAGAEVEIVLHGKQHKLKTDQHGELKVELEGGKTGTFELILLSEGTETTDGRTPPPHNPPPPGPGPSDNPAHSHKLTIATLRAIMPGATEDDCRTYVAPLDKAMREFAINSPRRQAAFLAQLAEESGQFHYKEEIADGSAYEGRSDLGNTHPGDGRRYKGRGLIQITGRANYVTVGRALGLDLVDSPTLLLHAGVSCRASCYFWWSHGLNELADRGEFITITERINGGTNGLGVREQYWANAKRAMGNSTVA